MWKDLKIFFIFVGVDTRHFSNFVSKFGCRAVYKKWHVAMNLIDYYCCSRLVFIIFSQGLTWHWLDFHFGKTNKPVVRLGSRLTIETGGLPKLDWFIEKLHAVTRVCIDCLRDLWIRIIFFVFNFFFNVSKKTRFIQAKLGESPLHKTIWTICCDLHIGGHFACYAGS